MTPFILAWNLFLVTSAVLANVVGLVVLLNSWHLYSTGSRNPEKLGYFVYLFLVLINLLYLVLCKVPLVHQHWHGAQFLFGEALCQWTLILSTAFSLVQLISISFYLASLALRLRRQRHLPFKSIHSNVTSVKEGVLLILASIGLSLIVGLIIMYRLRFDRQSDLEVDPEAKLLCQSDWQSLLWLTTVHWLFGFVGPLGLLVIPGLIQLFALRQRINRQLKPFVVLSTVIICTQCILKIPLFVVDVHKWLPKTEYVDYVYVSASGDRLVSTPATVAFVTYILTGLMPELQYIYIPLGIMLILPVTFACRATQVPIKKEFDTNNKDSLEDDRDNGNGNVNGSTHSLARRAMRKVQGKEVEVTNDDDEADECASLVETTTVVKADIHQRLSRSQTTIV